MSKEESPRTVLIGTAQQNANQPAKLQRTRTLELSTDEMERKHVCAVEVVTTGAGVASISTIPMRQQSLSEGQAVLASCTAGFQPCEDKERELPGPPVPERSTSIPGAGRQLNHAVKTFPDQSSRYVGSGASEKRSLQKQLEAYKLRLEQTQTRISHLEHENSRMNSEREQLESNVQRLQKHVFQRFESPDWTPASNAEINRKLSHLDSEVKTWSKANSISDLDVLTSKKYPLNFKYLMDALQGFSKSDDETSITIVPNDKGWVLVQAYIMHRLYFDVFDHPFFGVRSQLNEGTEVTETLQDVRSSEAKEEENTNRQFSHSLQTLYYKYRTCNAQEAVAWRVQALRQLSPSTSENDPYWDAKQNMCKETQKNREKAVQYLVSEYLDAVGLILRDSELDSVKNSLTAIVSTAALISYSLWTQKIDLSIMSLNKIDGIFTHSHALLNAHQLHSRHVDEDPAHLDGMPIVLITHPALIRLGNEEGTDFSVKTVLKKAVCWMGQIPNKGI